MSSLILKQAILLLSIIANPIYYLNAVTPRYTYKDGKRTEEIAGYVYTVTNTDTFDQINVSVENKPALITPDKLAELQNAGEKTFVEFENAMVRPYYSERTKAIEDSIKADSVHIVKTNK